MNALPILLLGGAALLMMGGKKNGAPKKLTGEGGDVVVDGVEAYWNVVPSVGGATQRWRWSIYHEDKGHIVSGDDEFATAEEAREDLRKTGISKGWRFKKATKANGKTTSEDEPAIGGDTGTPWFLMAHDLASAQVEERAKDCSNPQGFRAAVYPALKKRLDEYRDDAIAAGNVGFGENEVGGLTFKSDLQMLIDNILTMHCG